MLLEQFREMKKKVTSKYGFKEKSVNNASQ
jgi:hypothetical protein